MKFNAKYIAIGLSMIFIGGLFYFLSDIVTYILIAWVISMIGSPVMMYLKKFIGRSGAAIVTLSLFLCITIGIVWFFIPPLVNQVQNVSKIDYNLVLTSLEEPIIDWEKWLIEKKLMMPKPQSNLWENKNDSMKFETVPIIEIDSIPSVSNGRIIQFHVHLPKNEKIEIKEDNDENNFFSFLRSQMTTYLNPAKIQSIVNSLLNGMGDLFIAVFSIFFISFFFLREQGLFVDMIKATVPRDYEAQMVKVIDETSQLLIRYFVGIFFQVIIIMTLISLSLLLLGIKNALLIGVFAGLLNVIPYIGPMIAALIAVFVTITSNINGSFYLELMPTLTRLGIVFLVVRLIDDMILQPNIFSKSVKAHPLEIFLIVMIGAKIGGVIGMLLAIPFYTAFRVFGKIFLSEFMIIQKLTKNL